MKRRLAQYRAPRKCGRTTKTKSPRVISVSSGELGAPGASDRLAVSGALTLGARTGLWVRRAPGTTPAGSYTIVTHGGARTGEFVLLDAPTGTTVDYSTPGEVRVIVAAPPAPENIVFPSGALIVDVTQPPYNAIPNDGLDDTAAFQAAIDSEKPTVFIPPDGFFIINGVHDRRRLGELCLRGRDELFRHELHRVGARNARCRDEHPHRYRAAVSHLR